MDEKMGHTLSDVMKGLQVLANTMQSGFERLDSKIDAVRSELKADTKRVETGLRKLTTRFDDFLAQDHATRVERRSVSERLDNVERRLQRLEARQS